MTEHPMAQSLVDIFNGALQRLGTSKIISVNDNVPGARRCKLAWDGVRRSELRKYAWSFSIKRAVLAPDSTAPAFDYTYAFTLPADCLRVLLPTQTDTTTDWVLEGRKILTNLSNVMYLRYVSDVEDVTQYDAAFYEVAADALAMAICEDTTNSTAKMSALMDGYRGNVAQARRCNAIEKLPVAAPDDSFWTVRL
jgi:hypothetical protein